MYTLNYTHNRNDATRGSVNASVPRVCAYVYIVSETVEPPPCLRFLAVQSLCVGWNRKVCARPRFARLSRSADVMVHWKVPSRIQRITPPPINMPSAQRCTHLEMRGPPPTIAVAAIPTVAGRRITQSPIVVQAPASLLSSTALSATARGSCDASSVAGGEDRPDSGGQSQRQRRRTLTTSFLRRKRAEYEGEGGGEMVFGCVCVCSTTHACTTDVFSCRRLNARHNGPSFWCLCLF